ncbi:transposase, partial [Rothia nasimurium]|uniref:transposase n=1 Tax=Rothia nasimurium TaxID=85336 RepID=UPI001F031386
LRSRPCSLAWVMRFWASWCSVVMVLFSPVGVGRVYTVFLTVPPVYQAVTEQAAQAALEAFGQKWDEKYPAISALWWRRWEEFIPFLSYEMEVRRVLYSTNAIESLNARLRRSARSRGHFVSEESALKFMYLTVRSLDPSGAGARRWMTRWKPALNAFAIVFGDRLPQVAGR